MNEQRLQAYLTLTQQLFNCTTEEEWNRTIVENLELFDAGYIEFLNQYAKSFAEQGEAETAGALANLAAWLAGVLRMTESEPDLQDYLTFLQTVLLGEYDTDDPNIVYPILQRNLDKLNLTFAELLPGWARNIFANSSPEETEGIAGVIGNLCIDIQEFPLGNRSHNLEIAIAGYEVILEIYTRKAFPVAHATALNNLATAYKNRIRGDRAENLEKAIELYTEALEIRTRNAFPADHAMTLNNLATAYWNRIREDRAENLEKALELYTEALEIYTREAFPVDHAMTLNNLATAYKDRIRGDRAENLEKALELFTSALEIRTREAFPVDHAATLNNLAIAYKDRIREDRAENLEKALELFTSALEIRTREAFPVDHAATLNNFALAYSDRIRGERAENLEQAIEFYGQALEVYTPKSFPIECLTTSRSLGNLALKEGKNALAITAYDRAIQAIEISRTAALDDDRRTEILAQSIDVYFNIVQAYIKENRPDKALEYVERSRSKRLVDFIAVNDLYKGEELPADIQRYLDEYRELEGQINQIRHFLLVSKIGESATTPQATPKDLNKLKKEIETLENQKQEFYRKIRRHSLEIASTLQVDPLDLSGMQRLLDTPKTALLSFYTTGEHTHLFILEPNRATRVHTLKGQGIDALQNWIGENWLEPYVTDFNGWKNNMEKFLAELSRKLQIREIIENYLTEIEEIIIVPHLYLHQIPFAALPLEPDSTETQATSSSEQTETTRVSGKTRKSEITRSNPNLPVLGQRFRLRIVPSCQILDFCHQREKITGKPDLGIVEDARENLPFTRYECHKIAEIYNVTDKNKRLQGEKATLANFQTLIRQISHLHTSHHAKSDLENPLNSCLELADGILPLSYLLTNRIPNLGDVFTSCCETNLTLSNITDEPLTLATGFLIAGARSVVSTLWSVEDLASALLATLYYEARDRGFSRSLAMQTAQQSLRSLTGQDFATKYQKNIETYLKTLGNPQNLDKYASKDHPFAHPYYWAGFLSQGLA